MKIDQDISKLTSQLNQINQTTETLENDLLQLKINQKNISKQSNFQKEQQISFSQITQQLCKFDENVKDIKIYIDNHLKILDSTINSEKEIQNQKINQIQQNIKNELLQVRLDNKNFIQQLKQSQNDINTNQADLININNNIQNENILIIQKKCDQINNINSDPLRSQSIKIYINQLYDESSRKRDTAKEYQYYLRKVQSDEELFQYYRIQNAQQQMELRKYCSSFRQVRGDGNCFYSAFGFQYLELIIRFSNMEFDTLKNQILGKFTCQINYETFHSDQIPNFSNQLIFEFIYRIEQIRQIKDLNQRQLQLEQQFAAHDEENEGIDGCFYGIAIIFFRSLSNHLFQNSEMYLAISAFNNILIWEQEFNSTELIISELAKFLNIHVVLLFFDKNGFKVQEYQPQNQDKIILLIRPGHYNIGIQ
ncbi:unnamed protein product [Paramecium sonneborni]|uniref:OTU domain-containing protein n=1 Tax=Paramecium sonneborni TaxID=65129 RepID=A0A8S1QJ71_9CILI|nr:unnamed protein product [Paramecium sonneborni]